MLISIITVNYNGASDTIAMARSLAAVNFKYPIELLIVDNGSRGDDVEQLKSALPWATVIVSSLNLGFAGGNNFALYHAKGDYILYLNNDTIAEDDFIASMVDFMESNPTCGLSSPKILYSEDRSVHFGGFSAESAKLSRISPLEGGADCENATESPFAHGAAMLSRRSLLDEIGPMREDYFLYFEEMEYSIRARAEGYTVWYLPQSTVLHKGSATIGGLNPRSAHYSSRNYLYLIFDHTRGFRRIVLLADKLLLAGAKIELNYLLKGRIDLYWAHVRATWDFIFGRRGVIK